MSDNDTDGVDPDDGPASAFAALPKHLADFVELVMAGSEFKEAVETLFPGKYRRPKDAGHRWYHRLDVQKAIKEIRAEQLRKAERSQADVLNSMWEVHDRCMQRVRPIINRKGEHVTTETPDGDEASAYEFDASGAMRALEGLADYHGMSKKPTVQVNTTVQTENKTLTISTDDPVEASRLYEDMIKG